MDDSNKSDAMIQFELSMAELQDAQERGELGPLEGLKRYEEIFAEALSTGTASDREYLYGLKLKAHQAGAEILAEHGSPVPGNDPKKPN